MLSYKTFKFDSLPHGSQFTSVACVFSCRDEDVEQLRPIRNNLCDLFGIGQPVVIKVSLLFPYDTFWLYGGWFVLITNDKLLISCEQFWPLLK